MSNLKKIRSRQGLSQAALAMASGVSLSSVQKLEQSGGTPRLDLAARLARVLGVPILQLFPTIPIPAKGEGRRLFLAGYEEVINKLDDIEKLRFSIAMQFMPDDMFQTICSPFGPNPATWEEIVTIVHGYLISIVRQAKLCELLEDNSEGDNS
jgi:transcriptional regulator with XRE-family HTH domain